MGHADVGDEHTNGIMTDEHRSLVVILDESCSERHYHRKSHANGIHPPPPQIDGECEGILSKDDIELLLSMFDTGLHSRHSLGD
jgi:hypothetical protein